MSAKKKANPLQRIVVLALVVIVCIVGFASMSGNQSADTSSKSGKSESAEQPENKPIFSTDTMTATFDGLNDYAESTGFATVIFEVQNTSDVECLFVPSNTESTVNGYNVFPVGSGLFTVKPGNKEKLAANVSLESFGASKVSDIKNIDFVIEQYAGDMPSPDNLISSVHATVTV